MDFSGENQSSQFMLHKSVAKRKKTAKLGKKLLFRAVSGKIKTKDRSAKDRKENEENRTPPNGDKKTEFSPTSMLWFATTNNLI